ncbi:acylphosphatase [Cellulomonas soli]
MAQRVVVHGVVQGVGFRWWCSREAARLGLRGWVRNRQDGGVEALVEGDDDAVVTMVDELRHGPRHAVVREFEVADVHPSGLPRFVVEPCP